MSDIWDWYFGQKVAWFFRRARNVPLEDQCLELVPWLVTDTAHSGFGFVEYGTSDTRGQFNHLGPYWQNFDVIAHELGHQFIYATMGFSRRHQGGRALRHDRHGRIPRFPRIRRRSDRAPVHPAFRHRARRIC